MAKKKVEYKDFKKLYENLKNKVEENATLRCDPILNQRLESFERMAEMNDQLWAKIEEGPYVGMDDKGRTYVNPAIANYLKTDATLQKTAEWIEDKIAGINLSDEKERGW